MASDKHESNIIDDILTLIEYVRQEGQQHASPNDNAFVDVHHRLCQILRKLILAPVHGRLYVTAPCHYVSPAEQNVSLETHLVSAWTGVQRDA